MHLRFMLLASALGLCVAGAASAQSRAESMTACKGAEYRTAVAACSALIKRNAKDADAFYWRSLVYLKDGQPERATTDLEQAVKLAPRKEKEYREAYANEAAAIERRESDRRFDALQELF